MGGTHLLNILNAHYFLIYPFYRWGELSSYQWVLNPGFTSTLSNSGICVWTAVLLEHWHGGVISIKWFKWGSEFFRGSEEIAVLNGTLQGLSLTSLVLPSPLNPFSKIRHLQELRVRLSRKALQWYQGGLVICPHQSAHWEVPTLLQGFWWPQDQHLLF